MVCIRTVAMASAIAIAIGSQGASSSCIGSCDLVTPLQGILDIQEAHCSRYTETGFCDETHCAWSTHHGCRPKDVTSPFLELVEQTAYAGQIGHMIGIAQNCTHHRSAQTCGTGGSCLWAPSDDIRDQGGILPFSFEPCQPYMDSFFIDLLAFVFEHDAAATDLWHARADACHGRVAPNHCRAASDLGWAAGTTAADFPCSVNDHNDVDYCGIDVQHLIWAMAADAAAPASQSRGAFEGKVQCDVYDEMGRRPFPDDDNWGEVAWVEGTVGLPGIDDVAIADPDRLSGDTCAAAVAEQCPNHTIAYWFDGGAGNRWGGCATPGNCSCTCQKGEINGGDAGSGTTGRALYLGPAPCTAAGSNCTDLCVTNSWCRAEGGGGCEFSDAAVQAAHDADPSDQIAGMQTAEDHCAASNCSQSLCESTLGNECQWEDKAEEWGPGNGECKLFAEVWVMDEVTNGRSAWVKPFIGSLFGGCDDHDTEAACHAEILPGSLTQRCVWAPKIEGNGTGACGANLASAFVPALPDSACGGSLAELLHTFVGCAANLNEADCGSNAHFGNGDLCQWSHGICTPSIAHAEALGGIEYLPRTAYMPDPRACGCSAPCSEYVVDNTTRSNCATSPPATTTIEGGEGGEGGQSAAVRKRLVVTLPGDVNTMATETVIAVQDAIKAEVEAATGAGTVDYVVLTAGSIKATVVFKAGVADTAVETLASDLRSTPLTVSVGGTSMSSIGADAETYTVEADDGGNSPSAATASSIAFVITALTITLLL